MKRLIYSTGSYAVFRWYFTNSALPWASENGERFHDWIIRLKNNNNGDNVVLNFFISILLSLLRNDDFGLGRPDIIISIPPSKSYEDNPSYSLNKIAKIVNEVYFGIKSDHHYLRRTKTIPSKSHNCFVHKDSMHVSGDLPENVESVLLIDDVMTTNATLKAAGSLISESYPHVQITRFAFGETQRTGSTSFPEVPEFPDPWLTKTIGDLSKFHASLEKIRG